MTASGGGPGADESAASVPDRVAVVGGGAFGLTLAGDLARAGVAVTLYERAEGFDASRGADGGPPAVDAGSTRRAAGICYDAFADRLDARVAARALDRFRTLPVAFADRPYVWFARAGDASGATALREGAERMREHGRDVGLLAPEAFRERVEVDVAVEAAAVARDAGLADPAAYVATMADCARAAGATLRTGTAVGLAYDDGPLLTLPDGDRAFDACVVAAGADTAKVLAGAGAPVACKPYRVQALLTELTPAADSLPSLYDGTANVYARPWDGGLLVGDGTEERESDPDDWDRSADRSFRNGMAEYLADVGIESDVRTAWAGLCTATPDGDPLLGERRPGLFVATGWHGHGFMRAPALAERLAAAITDRPGASPLAGEGGDPLDRFDPTRFAGDEAFDVVEGMSLG